MISVYKFIRVRAIDQCLFTARLTNSKLQMNWCPFVSLLSLSLSRDIFVVKFQCSSPPAKGNLFDKYSVALNLLIIITYLITEEPL